MTLGVSQPPPRDEEEECISNKAVRTLMKAMFELFTKNQQSTDMTLEQVECSIARIIHRVEALETGVPTMDQDKLPDCTLEEDHDKEDEVEDDEPFNPPPQQQHRDDQRVHQELLCPLRRPNSQGMGGHPHNC
jgi:hypothetical protein